MVAETTPQFGRDCLKGEVEEKDWKSAAIKVNRKREDFADDKRFPTAFTTPGAKENCKGENKSQEDVG